MSPNRYVAATELQRSLMTLAVDQFLTEGGCRCELVRAAPGEWRAEWQRRHPREQLLLATIYVERETEARAALIAAIWDSLHGASYSEAAIHPEIHQ